MPPKFEKQYDPCHFWFQSQEKQILEINNERILHAVKSSIKIYVFFINRLAALRFFEVNSLLLSFLIKRSS